VGVAAPARERRPAGPAALDRRDALAAFALAGVALAFQLPIFARWMSLLDEGGIAEIGAQVAAGGVPYRDAVHVAFPGVFYLAGVLYRVFGPSLLVGRCVMVVAFTTLVVLVYLLARTVAARPVAVGAALATVAYRFWAFPHWQMLSYTTLAILLLTGAVAVLARDVGRGEGGLSAVAVAGLLAGVAAVFKQDCSGFVAVGLGLFVLAGPERRLARAGAFGLAAAVPIVVVLLAFWRMGLLAEMLRQTVVFPLVGLPAWEAMHPGEPHPYIGFPPFWPPLARDDAIRKAGFFSYFPSLVLDLRWKDVFNHPVFLGTALPEMFVRAVYLLPYAVLLALAIREIAGGRPRGRTVAGRRLRLLLVFAAALILSFNRPRDWVHLLVLYPPTLILLAPLAEWLAGPGGVRRRIVIGAGALAVGVALGASGRLMLAARRFYATPVASPRAGILADEDSAATMNAILAALATRPGESPAPLAALPYYPAINFLAARPLATRFFTLLPLEEFPDRQDQVLADLRRDPRTQILYGLQHLTYIPRPTAYAPRLFAALVDDWQLGPVFGGTRFDGRVFSLLVPRRPVAETVVVDLATRPAEGEPVAVTMWPFERPVLAVVPAITPATARVAWTVDAPAGARLRFGVGMNPDEWTHFLPSEIRFAVRVDGRLVFEQALDPRRRFDDRRWVWADLPLGTAGPHAIVFEAGVENEYGAIPNLAGWARPRIVLPPPGG
jgi:hypothetical protein